MNGIKQLVHFAPSVFPTKKVQEVSRSYALKWTIPREFPDCDTSGCMGGYFKLNTYLITVLGCLKKEEERKKMDNSDFRPFEVCHLNNTTLLLLGQAL